jgi:phospholipid/cholesterol/gamma-HCH transport system substrate-binding protein
MKFKFRHTEKIVGAFVFFALMILVAGFLIIGLSHKVLEKTFIFRTVLTDAAGLSTSTALKFKGYEIGKVKTFILNDNNDIDVTLAVYKAFREKIVHGSAIYRQVNPITGNMQLIYLYPTRFPISLSDKGENFLSLPENSIIPSLDKFDGQKLLEDKMVMKSGDSISLIFEDARDFVGNLRQEFMLKRDTIKTFFKNLGDFSETLVRNRDILDNINRLVKPDSGPVSETLERFSEISLQMKETVTQLDQLIQNYKEPDGLMLKLMQVERGQFAQTMKNLDKNLDTLHQVLLVLQEQTPNIAEVLERTRKTLESLNNNPLLRGGISKIDANKSRSKKKRMDIDK